MKTAKFNGASLNEHGGSTGIIANGHSPDVIGMSATGARNLVAPFDHDCGTRVQVDELVVNWHLTEACNYRCRYCYSTWSRPEARQDVCRDPVKAVALLRQLKEFFDPDNAENPLARKMSWNRVRLSIAGGEATLFKDLLPDLFAEAATLGFKLSLITNGSLLDDKQMAKVAPYLSILGISVDSASPDTNRRIGRVDRHNRVMDQGQLAARIDLARRVNPAITIKINTVVNSLNVGEDMTDWIRRSGPDRWKVLRVLPVISDCLVVRDAEFNAFLARHASLSAIMSPEDNHEMTESYIMVDPYGRFFQNTQGGGGDPYALSSPILDTGAPRAFSQIRFDADKFAARYHRPAPDQRAQA